MMLVEQTTVASGALPVAEFKDHLRLGTGFADDGVQDAVLEGDSWQSVEVLLGEASEAYVLRISQGGSLIRSENTSSPAWVYTAAQQASDGVTGAFTLEVAQVSDSFGAGLFRKVEING